MSSTVIPGLRYHDAPKAIDWLCEAFGFQRGLVVEEEPGLIAHAQLRHGTGMIMLGSVRDDELGTQIATTEQSGRPTMAIYVIVDDVESHAKRAKAAGADIFIEPEEQDYGGSNYSCRDLEGNVWSFGSYIPWTD